MINYKELVIWKKGVEILKKMYIISKRTPAEQKPDLIPALTRAATAVAASITNGSEEQKAKDYGNLQHALVAAYEVQTYLMIARQRKWIKRKDAVKLEMLVENETKKMHRFINKQTTGELTMNK